MHARVAAVTSTALLGTAAVLLAQAPDASAAARPAPVVVAHRGASARAPENTLAAVDKAAEMEVAWVENDVQRTKDGELVVIHDDTLRRTTNAAKIFPGRAPWKVKNFTAAEIAQLDAGSWFGPAFAGQRVPTLKQFVNRLDTHRQKLLLEIKNPQLYPGIEQQIIKVLGNEGWLDPWHLTSRLIVQSFDAASIRTVHGLRPAVRTGFLGTPAVADLPSYARFADLINPSHTTVTSEYVSAVHALRGPHHRRLQMYVWTVDDAVNARKAAGYGVDGIITNKPDVVRAALP
ncbi:glycerophosphodiester phosphodiesterase [Streptomyces acidiscabies]|uniref:glycerophosphodiester phosphodiesterase n=1 Tax=Streptomyces acidiscabies TaxID=42234 RepID=UPI000952D80D|nr:glycerophosphodiester phosphodiesterase family protein [Streptomyces acidiscabies]